MRKYLLAGAALAAMSAGSFAIAQNGAAPRSGGSVNPSTTQGAGAAPVQPSIGPSQGAGSLGAAADRGTTASPGTCGPGSSAPTAACSPTAGGPDVRSTGGAADSGKSGVAAVPRGSSSNNTE